MVDNNIQTLVGEQKELMRDLLFSSTNINMAMAAMTSYEKILWRTNTSQLTRKKKEKKRKGTLFKCLVGLALER